MQNEDIARLIVNAYNMGKADGHNEGYDKGYDKGYDRGFEAGVEYGKDISKEELIDEQLEGLEEAEEPGCTCPQCVSPAEYDAGYADGFGNTNPVPEDESYPYRTGYLDGQADSKDDRDRPYQKGRDWPV
jgi:hypothetical protein